MKKTNMGGRRKGAGNPGKKLMRPTEVKVETQVVRIDAPSLSDQQKMAARMLATGCFSQAKVAKALGVHENTISNWCEIPELTAFKELEQQKLAQDARLVFEPMLPGAISKYHEALDTPDNGRLGIEVAKDVFDHIYGKVAIGAAGGTNYNLQINIIDREPEKAYGEGEVIEGECRFTESE